MTDFEETNKKFYADMRKQMEDLIKEAEQNTAKKPEKARSFLDDLKADMDALIAESKKKPAVKKLEEKDESAIRSHVRRFS